MPRARRAALLLGAAALFRCTAAAVSGCAGQGEGACRAREGGLSEDAASDAGLGLVQKALRYASRQLEAGGSRRPGRPSVFVYELPAETTIDGREVVFRDACRSAKHACPEALGAGSEAEAVALFGYPLEASPDGGRTALKIRATAQFALGRIFLASLQRHPQRTDNPEEADLFFVPAFNEDPHPPERACPTAEQLLARLPHLNERTAGRHFWVAPTIAWGNNTCDAFNAKADDASPAMRLLAGVNKLALEDQACAPMSLRADSKAIDAVIGDAYLPPVAEHLHAIPYPSLLSGLSPADLAAWKYAVAAQQDRPTLVSGMWGMHGLSSTLDQRSKLARQCKASPRCSFKELSYDTTYGNADLVMNESLRATFCMEPTGDSVTRRGMLDSITAGCIPVLFSPLQAKCWPWHVGDWSQVAVLFDGVPKDVIGELERLSPDAIASRRAAMLRLLDGLTYSPPGQPRDDDALQVTLQKLAALR